MFTKAFEFLERAGKTFLLRWTLFLEVILQIADQVSRRMDFIKIRLELQRLDRQLEAAYFELGQAVFHHRNDRVSQMMARIRQFSSNRSYLDRKLMEMQDESSIDPLDEFLRRFRRGGGRIMSVDISGSEKAIGQLQLPVGARVIGIKRKEQVVIPRDDTPLYPGDRLFILAPAEKMDEIDKAV
jgi:hypothetical protein